MFHIKKQQENASENETAKVFRVTLPRRCVLLGTKHVYVPLSDFMSRHVRNEHELLPFAL